MKAAILALAATGALLFSTATADARPPSHGGYHGHSGYYGGYHGGYHHGYYGGYHGYNGVRFYPSINTSPYYGGYYGGYYPSYYYPNNGFFLGLGRFSLGIGNSYPYYGSYSYPYSWNW